MTFLDRTIDALIAVEGGYVNHPNDRGGPTNWGITEAVARENGYTGTMQALPRAVAKDVYVRRYWLLPGFDKVAAICEPIAAECLDTGVNMGVLWGSMFLQRSLNAFGRNGEDYPRIQVDGQCGDATLSALRSYMRARGRSNGESVLLRAMNALQGSRYIELTEQRPQNSAFTFGWFAHRVGM